MNPWQVAIELFVSNMTVVILTPESELFMKEAFDIVVMRGKVRKSLFLLSSVYARPLQQRPHTSDFVK
jgi:hypothetical protein